MLLWCLVMAGCVVKADEALCPGMSVSVHSLDKEDAETACKGAADAVAFLAALELDATAPVEVQLLERLPEGLAALRRWGRSPRRTACYMLTFSECRTWDSPPIYP